MDFLAHVSIESARFRAALAAVDLGTAVPTCPGWDASDLLWHLADVQQFWGTIVRDRLTEPPESPPPAEIPASTQLFEQFDAANELLVSALATTPDETPVWTWAATAQHVGFVRRRQAHEALIHRIDAELTAGAVTEIPADLATDGIAEALEHMFGGSPPWAREVEHGRIGTISTTDTGARWNVRLGHWSGTSPSTGTVYVDEGMLDIVPVADEAGPAFEISGRAADIDAWLWSRPPGATIERHGDVAALEAIVDHGVQ